MKKANLITKTRIATVEKARQKHHYLMPHDSPRIMSVYTYLKCTYLLVNNNIVDFIITAPIILYSGNQSIA
jgi:hypothetical protein